MRQTPTEKTQTLPTLVQRWGTRVGRASLQHFLIVIISALLAMSLLSTMGIITHLFPAHDLTAWTAHQDKVLRALVPEQQRVVRCIPCLMPIPGGQAYERDRLVTQQDDTEGRRPV